MGIQCKKNILKMVNSRLPVATSTEARVLMYLMIVLFCNDLSCHSKMFNGN